MSTQSTGANGSNRTPDATVTSPAGLAVGARPPLSLGWYGIGRRPQQSPFALAPEVTPLRDLRAAVADDAECLAILPVGHVDAVRWKQQPWLALA
jgi:hypothetical protein